MMELSAAGPAASDPEVFLLAQILNGAWGGFFTASPELVRARLASGHLFVLVRDQATPEELDYVRRTYGLEPDGGRIPIGLLETIDAVTHGDAARVPCPYAALTAGGAWRVPMPASDTLVLVDLTTAASRRSSGIGREIVRFALARRAAHHRHVYTFTPNEPALVAWHAKRGARETGVVLAGARPGHPTPDVAVMDYSATAPEDVT